MKEMFNKIFNNGHWQTIFPLYITNIFVKKVDYFRERIITPDDDFLDLDWINYNLTEVPTIILSPGLEGSSDSHYAKRIMSYIESIGWRGVVVHARGCSGELNKTLSFYHGGWTADLKYCLEYVAEKSSGNLFVAGVSLGGNALLKLLAEDKNIKNIVKAAIAISVPFDLSSSSHAIDKGINKFLYLPYFLKSLLPKMKQYSINHTALIYDEGVDTMHKFNEHYITQFGGFKNVEEYYNTSSSIYHLENVDTPTLIIQARNDPMICNSTWPKVINNPKIILKSLKSGGHAGFLSIEFNIKKSLFELPKEMIKYYKKYL